MPLCLFCRKNLARTAEHIIPKVFSKLLRKVSPFTAAHGAPLPHRAGQRYHTSKDIDVKLAAVCKACNGDFFNRLQAPVEPFMEDAIAGQPHALDSAERKALAAWSYKTALLLPLPSIPRTQWPLWILDACAAFHRQRRPPVGARIWAGHYDLRSSWPDLVTRVDYAQIHVRRRNVMHYGNQLLLTLGHLILITVYWTGPGPDELPNERKRFPTSEFIPIWPVYSGVLDWPPSKAVTYEELPRLSTTP